MWHNTSRSPKFFFLDGVCCYPLLLFILHASKFTAGVVLVTAFFLEMLRRRGINHNVLMWIIRRKVNGRYRPVKTSLRTYKRRARW